MHLLQRGLEKQRLAAENLRLREAVSLYKVGEAIAASLSLEEVLTTLGDAAVHDVRRRSTSTVARRRRGRLLRAAAQGQPRCCRAERRAPTSSGAACRRPTRWWSTSPDDAVLNVSGRPRAALPRRAERALPAAYALMAVPLKRASSTVGYIVALGSPARSALRRGPAKAPQHRSARAPRRPSRTRGSTKTSRRPSSRPSRASRAPSTRWTATPRATPTASRTTPPCSRRSSASAPEEVEIVRQAALMHDIGKIGCVLNLNKPGKLTQDEYEIFKKHPGYGREILEPIKFLHPLVPGVYLPPRALGRQGAIPLGPRAARTSRSSRASSPWPTPTTR
jgi:hypothetical protein